MRQCHFDLPLKRQSSLIMDQHSINRRLLLGNLRRNLTETRLSRDWIGRTRVHVSCMALNVQVHAFRPQ
jgi:hypothetical protein